VSAQVTSLPLSDLDRIRLIDEYGELDRQVQQFKPTSDRHEKLKSLIKSWYAESGPEPIGVIHGQRYELQVGAKETVRSWVSLPKVVKAVGGSKAFLEICTVAIAAVENVIGKSRTAALLDEAQTGTRRIKAVAKTATVLVQHSDAA
jgi:hypothetical protein